MEPMEPNNVFDASTVKDRQSAGQPWSQTAQPNAQVNESDESDNDVVYGSDDGDGGMVGEDVFQRASSGFHNARKGMRTGLNDTINNTKVMQTAASELLANVTLPRASQFMPRLPAALLPRATRPEAPSDGFESDGSDDSDTLMPQTQTATGTPDSNPPDGSVAVVRGYEQKIELRDFLVVGLTVREMREDLAYEYNKLSGFLEVTRVVLPHKVASRNRTVHVRYNAAAKMRIIGRATYGQGWLVVAVPTSHALVVGAHITAVAVDGMPVAPVLVGENGIRRKGMMQLEDFRGTKNLSDLVRTQRGDAIAITTSGKTSLILSRSATQNVRVVSAGSQKMRGVHIFAGVPATQYTDSTLGETATDASVLKRFDVLISITILRDNESHQVAVTNRLLDRAVRNVGGASGMSGMVLTLKQLISEAQLPIKLTARDTVQLEFVGNVGGARGSGDGGGMEVGDVIVRINNIKLQPHEAGKQQLDAWVASSRTDSAGTGTGDEWADERVTIEVAKKAAVAVGEEEGGGDGEQSRLNTQSRLLEKSVNLWSLSNYELFPDDERHGRVRLRSGGKHPPRSGSRTGTRGAGVAALRSAYGEALRTVCVSLLPELLPTPNAPTQHKNHHLPAEVHELMDQDVGSVSLMSEMVAANILMVMLLGGVLALDDVRLRPLAAIRKSAAVAFDGRGLAKTTVYKVLLVQLLHNLRNLPDRNLLNRLRLVQALPIFVERYESADKAEADGVKQGVALTLLSDIRFMSDSMFISMTDPGFRDHTVFADLLQTDKDLFVLNEEDNSYVHKEFSEETPPSTADVLLILQNGFNSLLGTPALLMKNRVVWSNVLYDAVLRTLEDKEGEQELQEWSKTLKSAGLYVAPGGRRLMYTRYTMQQQSTVINGKTVFTWNQVPIFDIIVEDEDKKAEARGGQGGHRVPLVVEVVRHVDIKRTLEKLYCCTRPNGLADRTTTTTTTNDVGDKTPQRGEGVAVGMGINKLEGYVHSKYWGISRRRIAHFLNNKEERQICRALRVPSTLRHLPPVYRFNDKWQLDSAKMGSTHRWWPTFRNNTPDHNGFSPYRGYVAAIDVFSRYAWIMPVRTKASSENDSIECFKKALEWCKGVYDGHKDRVQEPEFRTLGGVAFRPRVIQSDNGAEFGLAGGKIRPVVDGAMLSSWEFSEYMTPERKGTLSKFQRFLQENRVERYDTVRPAAPQQQAYIEVFNKTFKKIIRDMVLAGGTHHRALRRNPSKQLEIMVNACAKYNDSPHNSMPPHLTPHKLALCMMTQGVPGMEPWKTSLEVVAFRKAHYIGHSEKKRKSSSSDIDVGAFVRVALGEGRDYFDNDSTWQEQRRARENYDDRQASKSGLRKALGSNYSTQIYRVVGRRAPHPMSALQYFIAPVTLVDLAQFRFTALPAIAPGEHIMKRHIGFFGEHLQVVDLEHLEPMQKCSLRGVEGENYGAEGTECNPFKIADATRQEDIEEGLVTDSINDGDGDGNTTTTTTRQTRSKTARDISEGSEGTAATTGAIDGDDQATTTTMRQTRSKTRSKTRSNPTSESGQTAGGRRNSPRHEN
jgi:hypothetical protein